VTSSTPTINNTNHEKPRNHRLAVLVLLAILAASLPFLYPIVLLPLHLGTLFSTTKSVIFGGTEFAQGLGKRFGDARVESPSAIQTPAKFKAMDGNDVRLFTCAVQELSKRIEERPDDPDLQNRIGILYAQLGEPSTAIKHLETAIKLARTTAGVQLDNARRLDQSGDAAGSLNAMLESSRAHVELSAAHSNLARVYDRIGLHDRVLAQLDQLNYDIALSSDFSQAKPENRSLVIDQLPATNSEAGSHRLNSAAVAILARAQALMQSRRVSEAMREYRRLIRIDPQIALAHQQLGLCAVNVANVPLALSEFQTAVRLDPNDANSHNDLGLALLSQGSLTDAKDEFAKAIVIQPDHLDAGVNLSNVLASQGNFGAAEDILTKAATAHPGSAIAHNNLATVLSQQGKSTEAVREFERALALNANLASAHYGLGLALLALNAYPAAVKEFKTSLVLNPALVDAHNKIELANRKSEHLATGGSGIN
jgi:tetratricopeptide (TPR) repeat protein